MIILAVLIIIIGFFEIRAMSKKKLKKEIVLFVFLAILAFGLGLFYSLNTNRPSLAINMLTLFGFVD